MSQPAPPPALQNDEITARAIFYSSEPRLSLIFTSAPWKVLILSSLASLILLILPAWVFRLHSIPTAQGNLGLFYSYNWSIMYPFVIPLLLAMAVAVSERMKDCVVQLETNKRISNRPGCEDAGPYTKVLSAFLGKHGKTLVRGAVAVSVLVTLIDTHNLWIGYIPGLQVPASRGPEWDTGFNVLNWGPTYASPEFLQYIQNPPSKLGNFGLDVFAYILQTLILFLALYWVGKFLMLLFNFAEVIGDRHPTHQFNPLTEDLKLRLGLAPMGTLFDSFLAITVLIEAYAFYHRLHLIKLHNHVPLELYITTTLRNIILPPQNPSAPYPFSQVKEFFKLDNWAFNAVDVSAAITIVLMTVPIFVVCFLPIWRIRKVIETRRKAELDKLQDDYSEARRARDFQRVLAIEHEQECLENTNIWPNGDARAKRYLTLIFALAAGAIAPPLLALVIIVGISGSVTKYFKLIFSKKET
jgi:hypothetical protein